jgi:S1-C subfamily serine protease
MTLRMLSVSSVLALLSLGGLAAAQNPQSQIPTSVDSSLVFDAAGPEQRKSLSAILLIVCPNVGAGTGFLLDSGVVVTNAHVVSTCTEGNLEARTGSNRVLHFSKVIKDQVRDLALLLPTEKLENGLKLAKNDSPQPGTEVTTWGFPFLYDQTSPLLSVGYVSGFRKVGQNDRPVKHIVINGAFNHGNSGGPLLISRTRTSLINSLTH